MVVKSAFLTVIWSLGVFITPRYVESTVKLNVSIENMCGSMTFIKIARPALCLHII